MTEVVTELKIVTGIEVVIMKGAGIMIAKEKENTDTGLVLAQGGSQGIAPGLVRGHALKANGQAVLTWHHLVRH